MSTYGRPSSAAAPLLKNSSAAPFIYFDNAPLYGIAGIGIEVELTAASIVPKNSGSVTRESVCVAHLRCSPQTAMGLIDSLQKALQMHHDQMAALAAQAAEASKPKPQDKAA